MSRIRRSGLWIKHHPFKFIILWDACFIALVFCEKVLS